mgnify:CR=1 FL=1
MLADTLLADTLLADTLLADTPQKRNHTEKVLKRLGIARVILRKPELVILDEPTNGLDPAGMKQIRDLFRMLCTEYSMTLMISSHLLPEIESIADTFGVIHHGKMMKEIAETNTAYIELAVEDTKFQGN